MMENSLHPSAIEWGLPCWHDEASYGDTSTWGQSRWRWEFSRRRYDLRAYFDHWCEPDDEYLNGHGKRPETEGFCHVEARSKFGYSPLPNPRIGKHNPDLLFPSVNEGLGNIIRGSDGDGKIGDLLTFVGVQLTERQTQILSGFLPYRYAPIDENEMCLTFDLDKPIEAQLSHAKELLTFHQSERHGKALQTRKNQTKWLTYLRVLDGRECGASWSEISAILKYTSNKPQTARDVWQQAKALCFNFPF